MDKYLTVCHIKFTFEVNKIEIMIEIKSNMLAIIMMIHKKSCFQ